MSIRIRIIVIIYPGYLSGDCDKAIYPNCSIIAPALHRLSYDLHLEHRQREHTVSYKALEYIKEDLVNSFTQKVTIVTFTIEGPSLSGSITRIGQAIADIKKARPDTQFYSFGILFNGSVKFVEVLTAHGDNNPTHTHTFFSTEDGELIVDKFVEVLKEGDVSCPDIGKNLKCNNPRYHHENLTQAFFFFCTKIFLHALKALPGSSSDVPSLK